MTEKKKATKKSDKVAHIAIVMPLLCNQRPDPDAQWFCGQAELKRKDNLVVSQQRADTLDCAKNVAIEALLKVPLITHIFILEANTVPPDDAIDRLLAHDKDIAAGVIPIIIGNKPGRLGNPKKFNQAYKWKVSIDEPGNPLDYKKLPAHLFKATRVAGSAILVKRKVFETVGWPYFKRTEALKGTAESGNWYFSRMAQEKGFEIWADPNVKCQHYANVDLLGTYEAAMRTLQGSGITAQQLSEN